MINSDDTSMDQTVLLASSSRHVDEVAARQSKDCILTAVVILFALIKQIICFDINFIDKDWYSTCSVIIINTENGAKNVEVQNLEFVEKKGTIHVLKLRNNKTGALTVQHVCCDSSHDAYDYD